MKRHIFYFFFLCLFAAPLAWSQVISSDAPKFMPRYSLLEPKHIVKIANHHFFIDFGQDAFGTLVLTFKTKQRDTLIIQLGEKISSPQKIDQNPGGSIRYQKLKVVNVPVLKQYCVQLPADKRNTGPKAIALPDSVGVIMPFRYVEIENLDVPITEVNIRQKVYHDKFDDSASAFMSSDTLLNQIWSLCKNTIKATSFAGVYIDGDRERIPYEADAYINQLGHYCVDNEYLMAERTNEYFIKHPTWPTEWILHTVLLFYNDYLYTGNKSLLSKYYDDLKKRTLVALEREDGLISSKSPLMTNEFLKSINSKEKLKDIVDWPKSERDNYDMVEINTVVNSFHFMNLKLMAEISGCLGKEDDSIFFYKKSQLVKKSINEKLFDADKGIYVDGENSVHFSLHGNMFPLVFGLVPEKNVVSVVNFIKSKGMSCSVYGAQYLLEALYQQGEEDYALNLLTSTTDRSWWNMIKSGSTMTLEAWDKKYKPNLDWNHAWGTAPINIITRYMWGITPAAPGFTSVRIEPQLSHLSYSKIKVPTIKGAIKADYSVKGNHKIYLIELPKDTKGKFILSKDSPKIRINRKKVKPNNHVIILCSGLNKIKISE